MESDWLYLKNTPFEVTEFYTLWLVAALTFGAGDIITTYYVIWTTPSVVEMNTLLLHAVLEFGQPGIIALKISGFLLCIGISAYAAHVRDRFLFYLPPVVMTVFGTFFSVYNVRLLLAVNEVSFAIFSLFIGYIP